MMTNKNNIGKKDWQKVDARVLGQILAAQNIDFVLPDINHIAEFFVETLNTIPGITSCRVCLEGVTVQRGEMDGEICEECPAFRKRAAGQEISQFLPDFVFQCGLGEQPSMHINAVASLHHHFGFFIIRVSDSDVFDIYEPFIGNLANYVALSLENRLQRDLLQKSQVDLECKVEERTRELMNVNAQLQEGIEIKRQAEVTLQHEQELLSRIMETSPVGITLVDLEGRITFANSQAEKVLGLTRDEIAQRAYNAPDWHITTYDGDPFPDKDLPFQRVMSTGQPVYDVQHMIAWPDGHRLFLSINGAPILNEKGDIDSVVFTVENITERKQAEEKLRASVQLFRALVENSPDFIARYDREFRRIYVNPAIQSLFKGSTESPLDKTPADQSPIYAPQEYIEHLRQAIETATENIGEMPFRTAQGEMHWGQIRFVPEFDSEGKVATVLAIGRDIHEIKENEQRFRMLAENFPDFVIRFDRDSRCTYVNPAIGEAFGMPAEAIIGKTLRELPHFGNPKQNDTLMALIQRAFDEGIPNETEVHWDTETGERIFEIRCAPEKDAAGNVVSVLGIARDITERKQAEDELRQNREAALQFSEQLAVLQNVTNELSKAESSDDLCLLAVRLGRSRLGFDRLSIWFIEEHLGIMRGSFGTDEHGELRDERNAQVEFRHEGLAWRVFSQKEPMALVEHCPLYDHLGREVGEGDNAVAALWDGDEVIGVVCVDNLFTGQPIGERQLEVLRLYATTLGHLIRRKQTEEELRASETRFRTLVDHAADAFFLHDDSKDGTILDVNIQACKSLGYSREELIGMTGMDIDVGLDPSLRDGFKKRLDDGEEISLDSLHRRKDGSTFPVEIRIRPFWQGERRFSVSLARDVTERKRAEEELKNAHEQLERLLIFNEALLSAIPTPVFYKDKEGRYLGCNQAFAEFTGVSSDQIRGKTVIELWPSENAEVYHKKDLELMRNPKRQMYEFRVGDKDGVDHPVIFAKNVFRDENKQVSGIVGAFLDITERKQAELEHQAHLQFLESMDRVNRAIQGTSDLEQMMSDVLDVVLSIFDCDRAFLMYPCDPEASSWYSPMERTRPEYPGVLALAINEVPMDAEVARTFHIMLEADGPVKFGPGSSNPLPSDVSERFDIKSFMSMALYPKVGKPWQFGVHQCSYERIWTQEDERLLQEVGRRLSDALSSLLVYRNLQESEERYRQLVDVSPDAVVVYSQGRVVFVNPAAVRLAGAKSAEDLIGRSVLEFIQPDYSENVNKEIEQILKTGESGLFVRENILRVDGTKFDVEVAIVPYQFQGEDHIQILARDITERKQHEREREVIITVSTALRQATTRTEILNVLLDQLIDLFDAHGAVLVLPNPRTGGFINEMGRGVIGERMIGLNIPPGKGVCNWVITNKKPYLNNRADQDSIFYRPDLLGDSHCLVTAPLIAQEQAIGALLVARQVDFVEQDSRLLTAIADIAANAIHRVTLHEQTEQQLHRLTALHQIDLAISTNFDLNVTLNVILGNVRDELKVDAASILLLDPINHALDYTAGIGFRTNNIERSHVRLGKGCAGRAAQELRTISCVDIGEGGGIFVRSSLLASEEFVSHYATPLVVKGQIKGILEVFHRKTLEPEYSWLSYFETLATQAAIAIENASLFENLQRSNTELTLAYDATIEGWSRALDLRDRETEGHTQRVAEMALDLAEKMGMSDAEKLDLRRGALLHDIGKMGVPDAILRKPGPLSDEEWKIMRQHPLYAYQMLSPITYLKRALDIPYYHHEKWDGSGYPRGLKGDEIPLSARVFAVVDVFDALTSDRSYGKAWPHEEAYQYIREQAGKHFDPQVVEVFLETIEH